MDIIAARILRVFASFKEHMNGESIWDAFYEPVTDRTDSDISELTHLFKTMNLMI